MAKFDFLLLLSDPRFSFRLKSINNCLRGLRVDACCQSARLKSRVRNEGEGGMLKILRRKSISSDAAERDFCKGQLINVFCCLAAPLRLIH